MNCLDKNMKQSKSGRKYKKTTKHIHKKKDKLQVMKLAVLLCDIADVSLQQCKERLADMRERSKRDRFPQKLFTAEFIHANCNQVSLADRYENPDIQFDICSCQFALHYSFGSIEQAKCILRNACVNLKPGGYFIGTIPNANKILKLVRRNGSNKFENEVCLIKFDSTENLPLIGAKFDFSLVEVVSCPEYLVHFHLLVRLMEEEGMELISKLTSKEMVRMYGKRDGKQLMERMQALETYPPEDVAELASDADNQYRDTKATVSEITAEQLRRNDRRRVIVGTLSKDEWEVANLYVAFVFRKKLPEEVNNAPELRHVHTRDSHI